MESDARRERSGASREGLAQRSELAGVQGPPAIQEKTVEAWLAAAVADAERRGLGELKPMLETLARSTAALRAADAALRTTSDGTVGNKSRETPRSRGRREER